MIVLKWDLHSIYSFELCSPTFAYCAERNVTKGALKPQRNNQRKVFLYHSSHALALSRCILLKILAQWMNIRMIRLCYKFQFFTV